MSEPEQQDSSSKAMDRWLEVRGKVQNVMFRQTVIRAMQKRGLEGGATNDRQDRNLVRMTLRGDPERMEGLVAALREGKPINDWGARATSVEDERERGRVGRDKLVYIALTPHETKPDLSSAAASRRHCRLRSSGRRPAFLPAARTGPWSPSPPAPSSSPPGLQQHVTTRNNGQPLAPRQPKELPVLSRLTHSLRQLGQQVEQADGHDDGEEGRAHDHAQQVELLALLEVVELLHGLRHERVAGARLGGARVLVLERADEAVGAHVHLVLAEEEPRGRDVHHVAARRHVAEQEGAVRAHEGLRRSAPQFSGHRSGRWRTSVESHRDYNARCDCELSAIEPSVSHRWVS
ncbi:hypothetical protein ON010_g2284 [Phytophthora cinnamomi]|nr:hypothetical protein ON010_g2284 [Phytophthora cinnamomi]